MDNKPRGISNLDIRLVLELVDERIAQESTQQIDTAMLPLVAAEIAIIQLEKHWPYEEDMTATIIQMRENARKIAIKALSDSEEIK